MGEQRAGEGPVTASDAAKQTSGRASFRRPTRYHTGHRADPTAWQAEHHVQESIGEYPPQKDMQLLFNENRRTVAIYRAAGITDVEIYTLLKDF